MKHVSLRAWLVNNIPDHHNWCTKYTGKPTYINGVNAPMWMVYKLWFHPQNKCLYINQPDGTRREECICCHDMWFNMITLFTTLLVGGLASYIMGDSVTNVLLWLGVCAELLFISFCVLYILAVIRFGLKQPRKQETEGD